MRQLNFVTTLCVLLVACAAGPEWVKPGMTPAARDADMLACDSQTSHLAKDDADAVRIMDKCMAARGYEKKAAK
jgi:hypothetical protein